MSKKNKNRFIDYVKTLESVGRYFSHHLSPLNMKKFIFFFFLLYLLSKILYYIGYTAYLSYVYKKKAIQMIESKRYI